MKIPDSVRKSLDDLDLGESESAMLHACNAVDGTAKKVYPLLGSNARFTRFLRENYAILGPMAFPGADLQKTYFPVTVQRPKSPSGKPDLADVVYGIHRCCHGHGEELPDGFSLIPDVAGPRRITRIAFARGQVRLSDRIIPGLLAVVVLSPANKARANSKLKGYWLQYSDKAKLFINDWWGRAGDFPAIVAQDPVPDIGGLDLTDLGSSLPPHNISLDRSADSLLGKLLGRIEE